MAVFLFDLDGTLADTAPDLGAAVNFLRMKEDLPELELTSYKAFASQGVRGLLRFGLGVSPDDSRFELLRQQFLDYYQAHLCEKTVLFPGISDLLISFQKQNVRWGIVTNKIFGLADVLVKQLNLSPDVLVGGDSTPFMKPHPAPLWFACEKLNCPPSDCWFIGDDERDVLAGKAAGTKTISIGFGYYSVDADPLSWGADAHCETIDDLKSVCFGLI